VPGRLRGFRHWQVLPGVDGAPPRLASITANVVWPWTPTVEARCHRAEIAASGVAFSPIEPHPEEDVPAAHCSCGVYARHWLARSDQPDRVSGVIEAWGKAEVGENGFRARHARLVALANPQYRQHYGNAVYRGVGDETMTALGELYRVPVFSDERMMIDRYPPGDVTELLGGSKPAGCAGCEANRRGDYAVHDPGCPYLKHLHRNHVHVSFAPGGPLTHGNWPTPNQMGT
jgi:hypothetical protein